MLQTKCIKAAISHNDGLRISTMSRHTLSDGVTADPELTDERFDLWWVDLAPPLKLVGAYYRAEVDWSYFAQTYQDYLRTPERQEQVRALGAMATIQNVTVLCIEPAPAQCHRRLLAEEAQSIMPSLGVVIG